MVSDLKTFAHKGCKIAAQNRNFFCIGATIRIGREILCLPYAGIFLILYQKLKKQGDNEVNLF